MDVAVGAQRRCQSGIDLAVDQTAISPVAPRFVENER
jgi:hypothetical protein